MSQSGSTLDPEELGRLMKISDMLTEIEEIAAESETVGGPSEISVDDLPQELLESPMGDLTIRGAAEIQGTDIGGLPEEIVDTPLAELTLGEITRAIEAGDFGNVADQTIAVCGSEGCALIHNE
jgi:hypothetical protein